MPEKPKPALNPYWRDVTDSQLEDELRAIPESESAKIGGFKVERWGEILMIHGNTFNRPASSVPEAVTILRELAEKARERKDEAARYKGKTISEAWGTDELAAIARTNYPKMEIELDDGDYTLLFPAMKAFDALATRYPKLKRYMNSIKVMLPKGRLRDTDEDLTGTYAAHQFGSIILNPMWWTDPDRFQEEIDHSIDSGWHAFGTNSPEAVLIHESGHALDEALAADPRLRARWRKLKTELMDLPSPSEYAELGRRKRSVGGRTFDVAGETEGIAEAFAEYHTGGARSEYARRLGQWLEENLPKKEPK